MNGGWGIQVGQTAYPGPSSDLDGFQVLLLNRSNLALVSNTTYNTFNAFTAELFGIAISPGSTQANACGIAGCLEIIQSLNSIGYNPCPGADCYTQAFQNIGATLTLPNAPVTDLANLAYSFIGNIGNLDLHPGSFFERITCASSDGCIAPGAPTNSISDQAFLNGIAPNGVIGVMPNLANTGSTGSTNIPATSSMPAMTVSNNGAMAGELILDNDNNYTFAYPNPPIHFQFGVPSLGKNIVSLTFLRDRRCSFPTEPR
jgi:hypothetical protein